MLPLTRARLATLHRWTALTLLPVYAAILVSGGILALRPIREGRPVALAQPLAVERVLTLAAQLDRDGALEALGVESDGRTVKASVHGVWHAFDLRTLAPATLPPEPPRTFYDTAARVHTQLWFGAGGLVTVATFGMLVLIVSGPVLSRPRWKNNALSWHITAGWLLLPLLILLPLSAALMVLPIGRTPHFGRRPNPVTIAPALAIASRTIDLTRLRAAQRMGNGLVFVLTDGRYGASRYIVSADGAERIGNDVVEQARMIHEGAWAGAASGALNLAGALGLLGVMSTGITAWARRRLRRRPTARHVRDETADSRAA